MNKRVGWFSKESKILKNYYFLEGAKGVQKRLLQKGFARTIPAIYERARKLKIRGEMGNRGNNFKDISGRVIGNWVQVEYDREMSIIKGISYYRCVCKCNNIRFVARNRLVNGRSKSCGHCNDIEIGKMYSWLEPLCRTTDYTDFKSGKHRSRYICLCHYKGCGNYIVVVGHDLVRKNAQSCGCYNRERVKEAVSGENHWNWKGGITELALSIRTCFKNLSWKEFCRERDNYTCQKCGKNSHVEIHHCKIPFWKILEELTATGITDLKDIPDDSEFWNTNNGITLCEDCHKKFHSIYGNDFTKEEFEKWLGGENFGR